MRYNFVMVRRIILAAALSLAAAPARAEASPRDPVEVPAIGLRVALGGGRALASWRRYKRADFASYQLLKSTSDAPGCPETKPIFGSDQKGDISFEDGKLVPGTWFYRVCILTRFGDRWLSSVVPVVVRAEDLKRDVPTILDFEE